MNNSVYHFATATRYVSLIYWPSDPIESGVAITHPVSGENVKILAKDYYDNTYVVSVAAAPADLNHPPWSLTR